MAPRKTWPGWHPEYIKAEIRKTGITLTELSLKYGLGQTTVRQAILFTTCPAGEAAIIDYLQIPGHELWPERYDTHGNRIIGHAASQSRRKRGASQCQKGEAA